MHNSPRRRLRAITRTLAWLAPAAWLAWLPPSAARAGHALDFDGTDDHVTMGEAADLGLAVFTVECWFRWDGAGETVHTGTGGLDAYPLVAKGRGESDGGIQDMAWFLGIDGASGALAADFEDDAGGGNHPVVGVTDVTDGGWHHGAASYDGTTWVLYVDGIADATLDTGGYTPQVASAQHLSVGTAMDTTGAPAGAFRGAIDEVRLWSVARDADEVWATVNDPEPVGVTGLVARWAFDEGSGEQTADAVTGVYFGTIVGAGWAGEAPFDANAPPEPPTLVWPPDGGTDVDPDDAHPTVAVDDRDGDALTVSFHGRALPDDEAPFTVVALPDTQYYSCGCNGGDPATFLAQTGWIVDEREALGIAFVAHLGDCVDHGDSIEQEWVEADAALSLLEDPATTGLADGIPYGVAVGNHDQDGDGATGAEPSYNTWFGVDRFEGRGYYGGHLGADNDNHFALFSAAGYDFVVLFLEYDPAADPLVLDWAGGVLDDHLDRRGILVTHYVLNSGGELSPQGEVILDALGDRANLALMMGGHLSAEARRSDVFDDHTVHTLLADYQMREHGGDGWLRILEFDPAADLIRVRTYSPTLGLFESDDDSEFTLAMPMSLTRFDDVGALQDAVAGGEAAVAWGALEPGQRYEWFATVSDGRAVRSARWTFTAGEPAGDDDDSAGDDDDSAGDDDATGDDDITGDDDTVGDDDGLPPPVTEGCGCPTYSTRGASPEAQAMLIALAAFVWRRGRPR